MEWFVDLKCRTARRNLTSLDGKEAKFTPDRGLSMLFSGYPFISTTTTTTLFFHPKIYKKEKFIIIVQTMIGALAARNNLRVKNARQPVERKDV